MEGLTEMAPAVDAGLVAADAAGRVVFASARAAAILGRDVFPGEDVRAVFALPVTVDAFLSGETERRRVHAISAAGSDIEIDLTVVRSGTVRGDGIFFVFRDRTQEKQLEMDHRRFERLAAMGTMVAGFAHEVRNPMASLRSIVESLGEELADSGRELPHIARMLVVLERVEGLVRTSLDFGIPSPPRAAAHRPAALLAEAVLALQPRTRALGGELRVEVDRDLPDVFVDDGQLVQVLVVLLNNALDATGSPQRVLLRARYRRPSDLRAGKSDPPLPQFLRFEVHDDGPGIPGEIRSRIFDPFFTTKASGTGLGLSIAQQLVSENGGRMELVTAVGGPTVFSVILPLATPEVVRLARRSLARREGQAQR